MKTHPELPLDLLGQGDSNSSIKLQNHLGVVRPVLGHLLHTVYPDKAREVLLNDEALHDDFASLYPHASSRCTSQQEEMLVQSSIFNMEYEKETENMNGYLPISFWSKHRTEG